MINKVELKEDLDRFFYAAMAGICHCYDNTGQFYPDQCDCDTRKEISESMTLLSEEHKRLLRKYNL